MKALEYKLKRLQEERQRIEADMADANKTLQQAQHTLGDAGSRHNEVATRIVPLQRLVNDLTANQAAIETQRQAAVREIEVAEKLHGELLAQISEEIPEARRNAVQTAIEAVDAAIDDLKKSVQALQQKRGDTEAAVAEAQQRTAALEKGVRETLAQLRQLSGQIQTTRRQVTNLSAAASAAATSGRAGEVIYLTRELKRGLDELSQLVSTQKESELIDQLVAQWRESKTTNATIAEQTIVLNQIRQDLAAAGSELQRKLQGREADIKAALTLAETAETAAASQQTEPMERRERGHRSRKADQ